MQCLNPINIRNPDREIGGTLTVPCGRCLACLSRRRAEWRVRMEIETMHSTSAYFITLTYDENNVPRNTYRFGSNIDSFEIDSAPADTFIYSVRSVRKTDVQKFFKRFRKFVSTLEAENDTPLEDRAKLRYFLVAEYGKNTLRPHYHFILWNFPFGKGVLERALSEAWPFGIFHIGGVDPESINYCAKYCLTKGDEPYLSDPVFCLMSRRPGIGSQYIERVEYFGKHINRPDRCFVRDRTGHPVAMPRYYRLKIFDEDERKYHADKVLAMCQDRDLVLRECYSPEAVERIYENEKREYVRKVKKSLIKGKI